MLARVQPPSPFLPSRADVYKGATRAMTAPSESYVPPTDPIPADTALGAQVAEATQPPKSPLTVEFKGHAYAIKRSPNGHYMYYGPRDPMLAVKKVLLVDDDFERLLDLDADEINAFIEVMQKAWGIEQGN